MAYWVYIWKWTNTQYIHFTHSILIPYEQPQKLNIVKIKILNFSKQTSKTLLYSGTIEGLFNDTHLFSPIGNMNKLDVDSLQWDQFTLTETTAGEWPQIDMSRASLRIHIFLSHSANQFLELGCPSFTHISDGCNTAVSIPINISLYISIRIMKNSLIFSVDRFSGTGLPQTECNYRRNILIELLKCSTSLNIRQKLLKIKRVNWL